MARSFLDKEAEGAKNLKRELKEVAEQTERLASGMERVNQAALSTINPSGGGGRSPSIGTERSSRGGGGGSRRLTIIRPPADPFVNAPISPSGPGSGGAAPSPAPPPGGGGGGGGGGINNVQDFSRSINRLASAIERLDAGDNGAALRRNGLVR